MSAATAAVVECGVFNRERGTTAVGNAQFRGGSVIETTAQPGDTIPWGIGIILFRFSFLGCRPSGTLPINLVEKPQEPGHQFSWKIVRPSPVGIVAHHPISLY